MKLLERNLRVSEWRGVTIRVDTLVLYCGLLLLITLRFRLLPYFYTAFAGPVYWGVAIAITTGFLVSLFAREWFRLKKISADGKGEFCFSLFGSSSSSKISSFSECFSGELLSLSFSFIFLGLMLLSETTGLSEPFAATFFHLACANLTLTAIHLLPALPLDGGKAVTFFLLRNGKQTPGRLFLLSSFGLIVGATLITLGSYQVTRGVSMVGLWALFLGVLLILENHRAYEEQFTI